MRFSISLAGCALLVACLSACSPDEPSIDDGFPIITATPRVTPSGSSTPLPSASPTPTNLGTPTVTPTIVHQAVVRIKGTNGESFSGDLVDGSSSQSIDGTIPAQFSLINVRDFISASVRITSPGRHTLILEIVVDGVSEGEREAFSEFARLSLFVDLD